MAIPNFLQAIFWDINPKSSRPKQHPEYYIKRILELGSKKDFEWAKKTYGLKRIKEVLKNSKLSSKSANYWKTMLNV